MTACIYTLHALAWTAFGVVLGVALDRTVLALRRIARTTTTEEPVKPVQIRKRFGASVVPVVLIVLAAVSVVISVINANTNSAQDAEVLRTQQCQLAYANGFADALDARSDANEDWKKAIDKLFSETGELFNTPSPDSASRFQRAFAEYLDTRAAQQKQLQDNPYPPAPRDLCK